MMAGLLLLLQLVQLAAIANAAVVQTGVASRTKVCTPVEAATPAEAVSKYTASNPGAADVTCTPKPATAATSPGAVLLALAAEQRRDSHGARLRLMSRRQRSGRSLHTLGHTVLTFQCCSGRPPAPAAGAAAASPGPLSPPATDPVEKAGQDFAATQPGMSSTSSSRSSSSSSLAGGESPGPVPLMPTTSGESLGEPQQAQAAGGGGADVVPDGDPAVRAEYESVSEPDRAMGEDYYESHLVYNEPHPPWKVLSPGKKLIWIKHAKSVQNGDTDETFTVPAPPGMISPPPPLPTSSDSDSESEATPRQRPPLSVPATSSSDSESVDLGGDTPPLVRPVLPVGAL